MKTLLLSTILLVSNALAATELTFSIKGVKNNKGLVQVAIWESSNGFPEEYEKAVVLLTLELDDLKDVIVRDLPPGTYAMAVYHDENEDVVLNRGAFGIPKEGFGFSNNPRIRFGAPSFEKCSFILGAANTNLSVKLNYP